MPAISHVLPRGPRGGIISPQGQGCLCRDHQIMTGRLQAQPALCSCLWHDLVSDACIVLACTPKAWLCYTTYGITCNGKDPCQSLWWEGVACCTHHAVPYMMMCLASKLLSIISCQQPQCHYIQLYHLTLHCCRYCSTGMGMLACSSSVCSQQQPALGLSPGTVHRAIVWIAAVACHKVLLAPATPGTRLANGQTQLIWWT